MATGHKNNKSATKGIRFPYELIKEIDAAVETENSNGNNANFSSWVINACKEKLDKPKG
ncbi:DUF3950 domain-containing protein [Aggregatibacter aphrophilus]|uniref:YlcI/YnfO family protein n=1 Tax=Aggregatibacter aphrophilus TaxID=732 RepID=UPI000DADD9E9|nr:YlcI/YnfO family protein [Aggregatibacter aphrophilus]RDE92951.1 DUF3950 domain-containing protein [Aggregatibacter aphrophilus]